MTTTNTRINALEKRCRTSERCLPEAPYRVSLTRLHDDMLEDIRTLAHQSERNEAAMRMAVEALEESIDLVRSDYMSDWRHGVPSRKSQLDAMKAQVDAHEAAITALRERLDETT